MEGRRRSRHAWAGALSLWPGRALYVGPAFGTTPHAHHAVQVSIGLSGPVRIRRNTAARWQRPAAVLVAPDQEHQLDGEGGRVALLYLDPESTEGLAVATLAGARGVAPVVRRAVAACRRAVDVPDLRRPDTAELAVAAILAALVESSTMPRRLDPRIRKATASLATLGDARPTAAVLASGLGLSASRFGHLFREHTGLPFRRYVLWTRLQRAVREVTAGRATCKVGACAAVLADARAHFADHCALCHGNDGSGRTSIGENLYPKAPDMRTEATQRLTDGELFYIIHNGIRLTGMPAWGDDPPEDDLESWKLVHFIRRLPHLTEDDLVEMRALNPTSAHDREEEEDVQRFLQGGGAPSGHHERHKH